MKTPGWFLKRNFVAFMLWPLSMIYLLSHKIVYFCRDAVMLHSSSRTRRQRVPTICVGNIFAGGVGKTPIVREIAKYLNAPVVMRGYGAKRQSTEHRAQSIDIIGDEALMLKNSGLDVYTGDRKENIERLTAMGCGLTAVILDDGFQNPTIKKDISILVFDEKLGFGNGFILPAGPLREPVSAVKRADAVIVIRQTEDVRCKMASKKINSVAKDYSKPVFYAENKTIMPNECGARVAFSGIGYPRKFFDALNPAPMKTFSFPDHYQYTDADIIKLEKMAESMHAQLITTEKDWVRISKKHQKKIAFAKLETTIEPRFYKWLDAKIKK
jgi:tetraacyldisaccharide 4'-kinase